MESHCSILVSCFRIWGFIGFRENNPGKPNLVIILADDLGYADLGMHGSRQIPTPHIDKLGKEGIVFSSAYVSSSVCSPSRAGLLTDKSVKFWIK